MRNTTPMRRNFAVLASLLFLLAIVSSACNSAEPGKYKTENAIIFVMDGARYSETWGEPEHKYIPKIAGVLSKEGAVYTNFRNMGFTLTDPGHTALATGYYENIDNSGKELPTHPSFLQIWLKQTGQPKTAAWVIASKDKLEILSDTSNPEWHGKFNPAADCGVSGNGSKYREDEVTWDHLKSTLQRDHPRLLIVNFKQPDDAGHKKNWIAYLRGIQDKDEYAAELWTLLQADPFYAGKTALFVTNDHGRHLNGHLDGFVSHGDDCEGCRHIFLFAAGPDFKKDVVFDTAREQVDVPATIAEMMGIAMPGAKGHVLTELFKDKK